MSVAKNSLRIQITSFAAQTSAAKGTRQMIDFTRRSQ
jgi:hypothetical protein